MRKVRVFAPAKINLALHVTGQRADGFHLLDSLVAFAPVGDWLEIRTGNTLSLSVEGPERDGVPADMSNLVMKMAALIGGEAGIDAGAALLLEKHLPPASGIGGGSSDAAAALRGLIEFWALAPAASLDPALLARAQDRAQHPAMIEDCLSRLGSVSEEIVKLGADIPMCLRPSPQRVRGIGEALTPITLPLLPALLVNPRIEVPTPAVFRALRQKDNPPIPDTIPAFDAVPGCIDWLATLRNDLQAPAIEAEPRIANVLATLQALPDCRLARMSGSGATCFALFDTVEAAQTAGSLLCRSHPDWWIAGGLLGDQTARALPQFSD